MPSTDEHEHEHDPSCPFCRIALARPPHPPTTTIPSRETPQTPDPSDPSPSPATQQPLSPDLTDPPSYVVLSTPHVVAFLDIMPITRGHLLVATRRHVEKVTGMETLEGMEVSKLQFSLFGSCLGVKGPPDPHDAG